MPTGEDHWFDFERSSIDVRRTHFLQDALKEARKKRFDPEKLLNVSVVVETYNLSK